METALEAGAGKAGMHRFASLAGTNEIVSLGEVEAEDFPRLPTLIAAMADAYPVRIVDFGGQSPGGGPASLLRSMDLATHVSAAHLAAPAYISWMQGLVNAQHAQYLPALNDLVTLPAGQTVLRIEFDVPSPLS